MVSHSLWYTRTMTSDVWICVFYLFIILILWLLIEWTVAKTTKEMPFHRVLSSPTRRKWRMKNTHTHTHIYEYRPIMMMICVVVRALKTKTFLFEYKIWHFKKKCERKKCSSKSNNKSYPIKMADLCRWYLCYYVRSDPMMQNDDNHHHHQQQHHHHHVMKLMMMINISFFPIVKYIFFFFFSVEH